MHAPDEMLESLLEGFRADRDGLLHALIQQIDESMLLEISRSDYGNDEAAHGVALSQIREAGRVERMAWHPGEVLALMSWSRPEDPAWKPGGQGERGHIMRAFCCCALLQDTNYGGGGDNQRVASLIESVLRLGANLPDLTHAFLTWCLHQPDLEREERPFFVLGLSILEAARSDDPLLDARIGRMFHWIDVEDAAMRNGELAPVDERWLWGLTHFDLSHDIWMSLIRTHLGPDEQDEHAILQLFQQKLIVQHSRKRRTR